MQYLRLLIQKIIYFIYKKRGVFRDSLFLLYENYFIVLRHRSHIDVMSKNVLILPNLTAYDFTLQSNVKNGETQLTAVNTFGYAMRMGDIEANGTISIGDMNAYLQNANGFLEYLSADTDMNGIVNTEDYEKTLPNMSIIGVKEIR